METKCTACGAQYSAKLVLCPDCGAPNPTVSNESDAASPEPPDNAAQSLIAKDAGDSSDSAASTSSAPGETGATREPADTTSDSDLARKIKEFKAQGGDRSVIAVFGVKDSGKSYLNRRVEYLENATLTSTDGDTVVVRSTRQGAYTAAEFTYRYGVIV